MKYLHAMVRVTDIEQSKRFYCDGLGLREVRRSENEAGRYTLVFLAAPGDENAQVELTFNWDPEVYAGGRNFGHMAFEVEDIHATCERLMRLGVTIHRPPRDGVPDGAPRRRPGAVRLLRGCAAPDAPLDRAGPGR